MEELIIHIGFGIVLNLFAMNMFLLGIYWELIKIKKDK